MKRRSVMTGNRASCNPDGPPTDQQDRLDPGRPHITGPVHKYCITAVSYSGQFSRQHWPERRCEWLHVISGHRPGMPTTVVKGHEGIPAPLHAGQPRHEVFLALLGSWSSWNTTMRGCNQTYEWHTEVVYLLILLPSFRVILAIRVTLHTWMVTNLSCYGERLIQKE